MVTESTFASVYQLLLTLAMLGFIPKQAQASLDNLEEQSEIAEFHLEGTQKLVLRKTEVVESNQSYVQEQLEPLQELAATATETNNGVTLLRQDFISLLGHQLEKLEQRMLDDKAMYDGSIAEVAGQLQKINKEITRTTAQVQTQLEPLLEIPKTLNAIVTMHKDCSSHCNSSGSTDCPTLEEIVEGVCNSIVGETYYKWHYSTI